MAKMNDFHQFAEYHRPIIEAYMIDTISFSVNDERRKLEHAMKYSVQAGGKRIRPLIATATYSMFHRDVSPILPLAAAIELLHTYSLIHDDLPSMDNDVLRRGLPTCHVQFGEDIAILAGDTLNTFTFELLADRLPLYFPAATVLDVIRRFAHASGIAGMSGGQVLDLIGSTVQASESYLFQTHALKTGALLSASVTLPAILAGASPSELTVLNLFGDHIGQLFQIVDDLLDVTQTSENLGKSAQKDIEQNKLTYIRVFGIDATRELISKYIAEAHACLDSLTNFDTVVLRSMVDYIGDRQA